MEWLRYYIFFHDKKQPKAIDSTEIDAFVTYLVVGAASTKGQSLSIILFQVQGDLQGNPVKPIVYSLYGDGKLSLAFALFWKGHEERKKIPPKPLGEWRGDGNLLGPGQSDVLGKLRLRYYQSETVQHGGFRLKETVMRCGEGCCLWVVLSCALNEFFLHFLPILSFSP